MAHLVDDVHQVSGVGEVPVVQLQAHSIFVPVAVDVIDALSVEARRSPDDAVHLVPLLSTKKQANTNRSEYQGGGATVSGGGIARTSVVRSAPGNQVELLTATFSSKNSVELPRWS